VTNTVPMAQEAGWLTEGQILSHPKDPYAATSSEAAKVAHPRSGLVSHPSLSHPNTVMSQGLSAGSKAVAHPYREPCIGDLSHAEDHSPHAATKTPAVIEKEVA
jgi:hypothetical protein